MNAHTKQQEDKVFEMDFIDSQKSNSPFVHLLALSHVHYKRTWDGICVLFLCPAMFWDCVYLGSRPLEVIWLQIMG